MQEESGEPCWETVNLWASDKSEDASGGVLIVGTRNALFDQTLPPRSSWVQLSLERRTVECIKGEGVGARGEGHLTAEQLLRARNSNY